MRLAGSDVGERSRGLALAVGWPVDGQEHLPRVEVEQALHLREKLLLLQSFFQCRIDVARKAGVRSGAKPGKLERYGGVRNDACAAALPEPSPAMANITDANAHPRTRCSKTAIAAPRVLLQDRSRLR